MGHGQDSLQVLRELGFSQASLKQARFPGQLQTSSVSQGRKAEGQSQILGQPNVLGLRRLYSYLTLSPLSQSMEYGDWKDNWPRSQFGRQQRAGPTGDVAGGKTTVISESPSPRPAGASSWGPSVDWGAGNCNDLRGDFPLDLPPSSP